MEAGGALGRCVHLGQPAGCEHDVLNTHNRRIGLKTASSRRPSWPNDNAWHKTTPGRTRAHSGALPARVRARRPSRLAQSVATPQAQHTAILLSLPSALAGCLLARWRIECLRPIML